MRILHPTITDAPCQPCSVRDFCRRGFACRAFEVWCDTGRANDDRAPSREIFVRLFAAEIGVQALHRYWRREGAKRSAATQLGQVEPLDRRELGRRYRERLKLIWEVDPERRARELERKRADAMRRERERGRQPMTPERAAARSRLAWQRRRERAVAKGLAMSADEVRQARLQLGMTQRELAAAIGSKRSSIEHYETGENRAPPNVVSKIRALMREREKVPAPPEELFRSSGAGGVRLF